MRTATVLAAAATGLIVTLLSTSGTLTASPQEQQREPQRVGTPTVTRAAGTADAARELQVRVVTTTSLRPGVGRQVRIRVTDTHAPGDDSVRRRLLQIELDIRPEDAPAWVRPSRFTVRRDQLHWHRIELGLPAATACDADLGELHVRVREVAGDPAEGEAVVALPPVDCRDAPPAAPSTIHITDPVCGDDWREDLAAIDDGEAVDHGRCDPDNWDPDGERAARARAAQRAQERQRRADEAAEEAEEAEEEEAAEEAADEPEEQPEEGPDDAEGSGDGDDGSDGDEGSGDGDGSDGSGSEGGSDDEAP